MSRWGGHVKIPTESQLGRCISSHCRLEVLLVVLAVAGVTHGQNVQASDERIRLTNEAGRLLYGSQISTDTFSQLKKAIDAFSKAIRVAIRIPDKSNLLAARVTTDQLSACDKGKWRIVSLTTRSPNIILFDQSDLTMVQIPPPTAHPNDYFCIFDLSSSYIWGEAYFWTSPTPASSVRQDHIAAPPTPADSTNSGDQAADTETQVSTANSSSTSVAGVTASLAAARKPSTFETQFPALAQPGAVNAQFKYSPGFGSADQTSVNLTLDPYLRFDKAKSWFGLSLLYDYDSRPAKDPDALGAAITYAYRSSRETWRTPGSKSGGSAKQLGLGRARARPCAVNGKLIGVEYAPRHGDLNVITAWSCGLPLIVDLLHQPSWLTFTPSLGIETGGKVQATGVRPSTAIFRGVPGADSSIRWLWPALFGSKPLTLTTKYRARIPVTDETFTDASSLGSNQPLPSPVLTTKTRHYGESQFSLPVFKTFSVSLTYQYGSLPPSFIKFGHNIQVGIKASSPGDYEH